jgi:hypothetical protein
MRGPAFIATLLVLGLSAATARGDSCPFAAATSGEADGQPRAEVWGEGRLPAEALACLGLGAWQPDLTIKLTAAFPWSGDVEDLLRRMGSISLIKGTKYWSVTDHRWQELITDAAALAGPDQGLRRQDFLPAELRSNQDRYYVQYDNRSSTGVIHRLKILDVGEDFIDVSTENLTALRLSWIYAIAPQDLKSAYFIRKVAVGRWSYVQITTARLGWAATLQSVQSSLINRMVANYRYLAGIPTDREPPLRPN